MVTATNKNKVTRVLDLLNRGLSNKAVAKQAKCSLAYVYKLKKEHSNFIAPVNQPVKEVATTKPVRETLAERGGKYGPFYDQAGISQALKDVVYATLWQKEKRLAPDQMEALDMILHKIARIVNGDADYADSWHDIAGYAQLVETRLVTGEKI